MLLRILLVLLAIVALALFWRKGGQGRRRANPPAADPPAQDMVCCAHCGVYLPQQESVTADGLFYCSEAHRLAGGGKG